MIDMIDVGGVVILIAQELQCRSLTKQLKVHERVTADLIKKNEQYLKKIKSLENPQSPSKTPIKVTKNQNQSSINFSYNYGYDYELENFDLTKRNMSGKKINVS